MLLDRLPALLGLLSGTLIGLCDGDIKPIEERADIRANKDQS